MEDEEVKIITEAAKKQRGAQAELAALRSELEILRKRERLADETIRKANAWITEAKRLLGPKSSEMCEEALRATKPAAEPAAETANESKETK